MAGHHNDLHHALQNGDAGHIQVPAVFLRPHVQHHRHQALGGLHDEGGHAQGGDLAHDTGTEAQVFPADVQAGPARAQKAHHPHGADGLGQNGGQGCTLHPHAEYKDEQRVQQDIQHRPDEYRAHGRHGLSLGADKGVQAQGKLYKDRPQQIDGQIVGGIADGVRRCAEGQQQWPLKYRKAHSQNQGHGHQHGHGAAQNGLCPLPVPRPQADGCQRGAPHARKGGKGGDQGEDGKGHPHTGEGRFSHHGNVADIDPVHDVIQHVDKLGGHSGGGQAEHQRADGRAGQRLFILKGPGHNRSSSFFTGLTLVRFFPQKTELGLRTEHRHKNQAKARQQPPSHRIAVKQHGGQHAEHRLQRQDN